MNWLVKPLGYKWVKVAIEKQEYDIAVHDLEEQEWFELQEQSGAYKLQKIGANEND